MFAFLFFAISAIGQEKVLDQEITIAFEDISIKESLEKLEKMAHVNTAYNELEIADSKVNITFEKELLSEVLESLLANKNLTYKVVGNTITVYRAEPKPELTTIPEPIEKTKVDIKEVSKEKFTLSGYITDLESQESLIGANIFVKDLSIGVNTNEYGFYSLTIPSGNYELSFSYIGYQTQVKEIALDVDTELSIALSAGNQLKEIVVTDDAVALRHTETKMSSNKLSMEKLKSMPVLMGERDVLKMVQLMPGIQSGSEGSTGLYVRGGGPDQNLILIDGVPVYNVNHLFGFLSTLNGDAIKSAEIIKGGHPARYGGRLSSILDVRMKEGNMEKFHGEISAGVVAGKINLEGPIIKNKTSFSVSGRRTWLDLFAVPIQKRMKQPAGVERWTAYHFYDFNAKINHKFSDKSRLYLSTYQGQDLNTSFDKTVTKSEDLKIKWGNRIFALRWNYQISPKLFSNTTAYSSYYHFKFDSTIESTLASGMLEKGINESNSQIVDYGGKIDFNYLPTPQHHIRFGLGALSHKFTPTVSSQTLIEGVATPVTIVDGNKDVNALEYTMYVEDDMSLGDRLKLNVGLHAASFDVDDTRYNSFQPRAAMSYTLSDKSSLKLSYSQMTQFLHLLASPGLGLPTDLWVPSTKRIKPESSVQYALGYNQSLKNGYEATCEVYYKTMDNLLEYKSGFNVFGNSKEWEDKVWVGKGESYGIEFLLEKTSGKTTGWIGYTWSKSNRIFPDLNNGIKFPYKYDRRHDVSVAVTHKRNERMDFGLIWVYGTGNAYTLGTSNIAAITAGSNPYFGNGNLENLVEANNVDSRNNQRVPAYHRLDLSINLHKVKKKGTRTWSFGVYNAYSRQNPFVVYLRQKKDNNNKDVLILEQISLIPIIPFATYSFKF